MKTFVTMAVLSSLVACSKNEQPPVMVPASRSVEAGTEPLADDKIPSKDPTQGQLVISDRIREACGLSETEAYFDYDSAKLSPAARAVLAKLATCFAEGPLRDEAMRLVGHADPRGSDEYNMVLASRRAENVKAAVVSMGLPEPRVTTSSRGEMDATGEDEAGWARDRKVEVLLRE